MSKLASNVTNSVTKGETLANQTTESMNEIDKEVKKLIEITESISLIKKEVDLPIKKISKSPLVLKNINDLSGNDVDSTVEFVYEEF